MTRRPQFAIIYAPQVSGHVAALDAKYHMALRRAIHEQLAFAPDQETRNRKPLEELPGPLGATWELRCGPANRFRVFYEIVAEAHEVWVLAIGEKDRNRLRIGGKEYEP